MIRMRVCSDSALAISTSCCSPTRSVPDQRRRRGAEVQRLEQLRRRLQLAAPVDEERASDHLRAEKDVVGHGHARHQVELLVDDRDAVPGRVAGALKSHRHPVDRDLALVVGVDPAGDLHQRRLAGAILAHQRMDLAGARREIDAFEHRDVAERFADAAHGEQRWSGWLAHSGRRASLDPAARGPRSRHARSPVMRHPRADCKSALAGHPAPLRPPLVRAVRLDRRRMRRPHAGLVAERDAPAISRARIP